MTYMLTHDDGEQIGIGFESWSAVLELAVEHGWQAYGVLDGDEEFPASMGDYAVEWYRSCSPMPGKDALAFADALEKALLQMSDDDMKARLEKLIPFCRSGGFRIEP